MRFRKGVCVSECDAAMAIAVATVAQVSNSHSSSSAKQTYSKSGAF